MNMNKLINEVKSKSGLVGHLSSVISDVAIRDIIYMSLDEFNRYSSTKLSIPMNIYSKNFPTLSIPIYDATNTLAQEIIMPIDKGLVDTLRDNGVTIKNVVLERSNTWVDYASPTNMKNSMVDYRYGQEKANNTTKPEIRFVPPDKFAILNYTPNISYYQNFNVVLRVTHPKTLSTISLGLERWFEELCRRNVEIILYNNDLRFLNPDIGTASVNMDLSNFQNAESEKASLMEEIRARAAADQVHVN